MCGSAGGSCTESEERCNLVLMATTLEQIVEDAMTLPSESRARLADLLVQSLDVDDLGPTDQLWSAEAKRRRDEVRAGKVETIEGEDALRKVRDSIGR
jgi:putative addiction module component